MATSNEVRIFSITDLRNTSGQQAVEPDDTNGGGISGTLSFGGDDFKDGALVSIVDRDRGTNDEVFQDSVRRQQFLEENVTLEYTDEDGNVLRDIFPAGHQVQAEFAIEFDTGYRIIVVRVEEPGDTTPGSPNTPADDLVNAGFIIVPPPGGSLIPPGGTFGTVTGTTGNGNTPYSDITGPAVLCFAAGTAIRTPDGPRAVETLMIGDRVTTADGGVRSLSYVGQDVIAQDVWAFRPETWPVVVPVGALGNARPLLLSRQHRVRLEGAAVELTCGRDAVLTPIHALIGMGGIAPRRPDGDIRYHHVATDGHDLIVAEGAVCETLLVTTERAGWASGSVMERELSAVSATEAVLALPEATTAEARAAFAMILDMRDRPGRRVAGT